MHSSRQTDGGLEMANRKPAVWICTIYVTGISEKKLNRQQYKKMVESDEGRKSKERVTDQMRCGKVVTVVMTVFFVSFHRVVGCLSFLIRLHPAIQGPRVPHTRDPAVKVEPMVRYGTSLTPGPVFTQYCCGRGFCPHDIYLTKRPIQHRRENKNPKMQSCPLKGSRQRQMDTYYFVQYILHTPVSRSVLKVCIVQYNTHVSYLGAGPDQEKIRRLRPIVITPVSFRSFSLFFFFLFWGGNGVEARGWRVGAGRVACGLETDERLKG